MALQQFTKKAGRHLIHHSDRSIQYCKPGIPGPIRGVAAQHLEQAIFLCNYNRPHLSCAMQSPTEAHRSCRPLEQNWKNYYKPTVTEPPK